MGRILLAITLFFVIMCGAIYYILTGAPTILSAFLSKRIQTHVKVKRIEFNKGAISVQDFIIKNPRGAVLPDALKIQKTTIAAPYKDYFKNPITIDDITLDNVYLSVLLKKGHTTPCNWHHIFKEMDQKGSGPDFNPQRSFIIKTITINNLQVELARAGAKPQTIPIDRLQFKDVRSETGFPIQELSQAITQKLISEIFSLNTVKKAAESLVEAPFEAFKFIFGGSSSKDAEDPCHEP